MKYLSAQQLAFLLDIKVSDAKDKIIACIYKEKGEAIPRKISSDDKKDISNVLSVDILSKHLGIPHLSDMVEDITENYLKRSATRKYILSDYPEKHIKSCEKSGKIKNIIIPTGLRLFLKQEDIDFIHNKWRERYSGWFKLLEEKL